MTTCQRRGREQQYRCDKRLNPTQRGYSSPLNHSFYPCFTSTLSLWRFGSLKIAEKMHHYRNHTTAMSCSYLHFTTYYIVVHQENMDDRQQNSDIKGEITLLQVSLIEGTGSRGREFWKL